MARGLTADDIAVPATLDSHQHLLSPDQLPDLVPAVERIRHAVARQEKIMIFGDYDADGVTATAVLFRALKALGAVVSYRLPHRAQDGYGLKEYFIREMAELGVSLLITVDNGIAAHPEIALAHELGIEVLVTDHHQPPAVLPTPAIALINPHRLDSDYPYPHLSGSVVAWKLVQALLEPDNPLTSQLMAWALIGLIADCMPLQQENRRFVQIALPHLQQSRHRGLRALGEKLGLKWEHLSTDDIAYYLAPCLNAAGRLDSPLLALHLFLQEDKAVPLAEHLYRLNRQRQDLTEQYYAEAEEILAPTYQPTDPLIMVGSDRWHPGIIGLIAGRLATKYARPAIVMSKVNDAIVG